VKCPACGNAMTEVKVQDIKVDVCQGGCGGMWFDWFELKKVDEPHEALGEDLMRAERDGSVKVFEDGKRFCPRCDGMPMLKHFASVKREVNVDECPNCAGFFLDHGELNTIRDQFATEEERSEAAQAVFADLFDEGLDQLADESDETAARARAVARMFRFLLPSYWLPGKQKWGAY
jgi:Zn-finger nucleic acid-binding protein